MEKEEREDDMTTALATTQSTGIDLAPAEVEKKLKAIRAFQSVVHKSLIDGHDFGVIPGTPKPTLLKPGAEKVAKLLNLHDDYEVLNEVEDWQAPFFYYKIKCVLRDIFSKSPVSSGLGSCNSKEKKYNYRWVPESQVPSSLDKKELESRDDVRNVFEFEFAISKSETTGKYGKPKEYWEKFRQAIKEGKATKVEKPTKSGKSYPGYEMRVGDVQYRIPNPEIYDQVNTILKMAKKRALVDAALSAGRLSDLFTQDIEDILPVVETTAEKVEAEDVPVTTKTEVSSDTGFLIQENPESIKDQISKEMERLVDDCGVDVGELLLKIKANVKTAFKRDVVRIPEDLTEAESERVLDYLEKLVKTKGKK